MVKPEEEDKDFANYEKRGKLSRFKGAEFRQRSVDQCQLIEGLKTKKKKKTSNIVVIVFTQNTCMIITKLDNFEKN